MKERTNTQNFLIQHIISETVSRIAEDQEVEIDEALRIFYSTKIASKLEDIQTGLYLEGDSYFYNLLKEELENKKDT